ncbi:hypothetical protein OU995_07770 [Roseateles sp. SL47]|uniref:hypothetical protein n=1 Tax=Roseateles sp. SL47 TaxID=2995138 RepID=UPI00226E0E09|nr:hypothetical protein [Roseateles sp. SL47]WAC74593.1 hypothetical protein OU995_07770 [Roseateles sp. SL47]
MLPVSPAHRPTNTTNVERQRPLSPPTSPTAERTGRTGTPSVISTREGSRTPINSNTEGRSGRVGTLSRRRPSRSASGVGLGESETAPEASRDRETEPLVVHATDPHQQYTRSNIWQQIFSMLHDAVSKIFDMGQKVVDLAHRGMEIITTRIS